jgi:hypothetical protein
MLIHTTYLHLCAKLPWLMEQYSRVPAICLAQNRMRSPLDIHLKHDFNNAIVYLNDTLTSCIAA